MDTMQRHLITVPGIPVAWARARRAGNKHFPAERQANYKTKIQLCARAAGVRMAHAGVRISIDAYWAIAKAPEARTRRIGVDPDADNVAKMVLDALKGIAYPDDNWAALGHVERWYAPRGEAARCEIVVEVLP